MNLFIHKWIPRFFYKKFDGGKESGVTKSLGDWVEESPFCYATVFSRLSRGWIVKEAIFGKQINRKS